METKKTFHLRDLLIAFLALILVLGIGYKYLEWNFFNKLSSLQSSTIPQELAIVERLDKLYDDSLIPLEELVSEGITEERQIEIYDDMDGSLNLVIDSDKNYLNVMQTLTIKAICLFQAN